MDSGHEFTVHKEDSGKMPESLQMLVWLVAFGFCLMFWAGVIALLL